MSVNSLVWILIGGTALVIAIDFLCLRRRENVKLRPTFNERVRQNPTAFKYALGIMSKLNESEAETMKTYLNVNDEPPKNHVELLDLIDQHIVWQGIADGRAGTVGNPHAAEVIKLKALYAEVQRLVGPVPEAKREKIHAAVTGLQPNIVVERDALQARAPHSEH